MAQAEVAAGKPQRTARSSLVRLHQHSQVESELAHAELPTLNPSYEGFCAEMDQFRTPRPMMWWGRQQTGLIEAALGLGRAERAPVRELSPAGKTRNRMEGHGEMREANGNENELAMHTTTDQGRDNRGDGEAMSPSMRELILSFGEADSERTWDPDAYTRQRSAA